MSALRRSVLGARWRVLTLLFMECALVAPALGLDLVVPAAAFRGHVRNAFGFDSADGFVWSGQAGNPGCLAAPIYLQDYDEILSFSADLLDDDVSSDFSIQLWRHSVVDPAASPQVVAGISTSGASAAIQRLFAPSILLPDVNTDSYVYYLTTSVCLTADSYDHRVYGVRVRTALLFADGFESADTSAWGSGPGGSTAGFQIRSIPGAAYFHTWGSGNVSDGWFDPAGGYLRVDRNVTGGQGQCVRAPVQLPQGATMTLVDGSFYDNTTATNLVVNLWRKAYTNATAAVVIASLQTSGASTLIQYPSDTVDQPVVDNQTYSYYFQVCDGTDLPLGHTLLRIYDTRVIYTR